MVYPNRLLPQPSYGIITNASVLGAYYLQRTTIDHQIIDPETKKIKPEYISLQTGHLHDLSTNLVGIFLPEDRFLQFKGDRKAYFTREPWLAGEPVDTPLYPEDFENIDTIGAIYFLVNHIDGLEITYNIGEKDGFTAVCRILHIPVRSNFWHFSLRWFNQEGDILMQNGNWKKRMLTSARAALMEYGRVDPPDQLVPIPVELYS